VADQYNAWLRTLSPESVVAGTDELDRAYVEEQQPEVRCDVRRAPGMQVGLAFGNTAVEAYQVRLVTEEPIEHGWTVEIRRDGETEWRQFVVQDRIDGTHTRLTVRRA